MLLNPFITSEVFEKEDFFNRKFEISQFKQFIESNYKLLLITGKRRVGKTSLIKKLSADYENLGFNTIYFSLQGEAFSSATEILAKIAEAIIEIHNLDWLWIEDELSPKIFTEFIDNLQNTIIFLDELDAICQQDTKKLTFIPTNDFLDTLKQILENYTSNVKFVISGACTYPIFKQYCLKKLENYAQIIEVEYFDKQTVIEILSKSTEIEFTTEAKEYIWNLTDGYPYFVQCLSKCVFDYAELLNIKQITPKIVNNVLNSDLNFCLSGFYSIWNDLFEIDRKYLISIINDTSLPQQAINRLISSQLITIENNKPQIKPKILKYLISKTITTPHKLL